MASRQNRTSTFAGLPTRSSPYDALAAAAHEGALEARAGNAIESDIEHKQPVLQKRLLQGGKMPFGIGRTDAEIALGFHPQHSRRNQRVGPAQYVLLEALHIDLEEVRAREHALRQQRVQAAHPNVA